jgi:hypothetical protein
MIVAALLLATRFELQSNFWVSLHQRLQNDSVATTASIKDEEWTHAVDAYRTQFGHRSPFLDPELVAINDSLSSTREEDEPRGIPAAVHDVLVRIAPFYRRAQWPADDRANRFWIASVEGMLHDTESDLIREHERVYGVKWPTHIRVDVAPFAGPFGGYTTGDAKLTHTTVSSLNPTYRGFASLEMLMHESSHGVIDEPLVADRAKLTAEKTAPEGLWHAIIFYTSGELTKRVLATRGVTDYVPYAYAHGNYKRGPWPYYLPWLEKFWQAHIDGKLERDEAIDLILRELTLD